MGGHVRLSKSSDRKVENMSTAGVVSNFPAGRWSLVLWSIMKTNMKAHEAQSGYGPLRVTGYILCPVI